MPPAGPPEDPALDALVRDHYDNPWLRDLEGEIHFDDELSEADIGVAAAVLEQATGIRLGELAVFLPCAGTLRHIGPLLRRGVPTVVAVDLSRASLDAGIARYGEMAGERVRVHHGDVRELDGVVEAGSVRHAVLMANSLGDITDLEGHQALLRALAAVLAPGGALVFDYVGDRYCPPAGETVDTVWPETLRTASGPRAVTDRRRRWYEPQDEGLGILRCTCELRDRAGAVLDRHAYARLVVRDDVLREQFAGCGLELTGAGPMVALSPYHHHRVATRDDLGMCGTPDHVYVAVRRG